MKIDLWQEHGEWVAAAPDVLIHTFGANEDEALGSLFSEMVEEYNYLHAEHAKGGIAPSSPAAYQYAVLRAMFFGPEATG